MSEMWMGALILWCNRCWSFSCFVCFSLYCELKSDKYDALYERNMLHVAMQVWNVILPKKYLYFITVNMTILKQKKSECEEKQQHEENTLSNKIQQTQSRSIVVWCLYCVCVCVCVYVCVCVCACVCDEGEGQTQTGLHVKAAQL